MENILCIKKNKGKLKIVKKYNKKSFGYNLRNNNYGAYKNLQSAEYAF